MPADPTHYPTFRRANRKQEDDIETRRARGEVSCAECRRLKLKCDRKLPCGSCTRRGCPSLCPNGMLATGYGVRSALADSAHLHTKISEMAERIRRLESALASSHSVVSNEVHPLLKEELLSIGKYNSESANIPANPKQPAEQIIDALGTMSIGERGEGKYFGRSAGTEMLVLAGAEIEQLQSVPTQELPPELASAAVTFPFSSSDLEIPWDVLFRHLPSEPRAWTLCETYMEHSAWKFDPIRRDQLVNEVLSPIYRALKEHKSTGIYNTGRLSVHHFAALYFVFAIGTTLDLTMEPVNGEATTYFDIGRGALGLRPIFDSQEIICVQAVLLMSHYKLGGKRYTMDGSWYLVSVAAKLAQGLGLHRDSSRFRMDQKTIQRRRHLFWELFSMDLFSSVWLGRPPTLRLADTDCEFPDDDEATVDEHGNTLMGFSRWKFEFTKEVFAVIAERTTTAEAPNYQTILELDRKMREKVLPPHLSYYLDPRVQDFSPYKYLKRCLLGMYRCHVAIYLHRSFCMQAMLDNPKNPLQSPFAPSYLATYHCASNFVKAVVNHFETIPDLCSRIWSIWTTTFSAAVIIGAIIIRTPTSSMASRGFNELGLACDLFENGVKRGMLQSEKGRAALAILNNLRVKALQAYSNVRSSRPEAGRYPETEKLDENFDELALFGGRTKILVCQWLASSSNAEELVQLPTPPSQPSPSMDLTSSLPSSGEEHGTIADYTNQVHPGLVHFISTISPPDFNSHQGVDPIPTFNYSDQPVLQDGPLWANYIAPCNTDSHPPIFSQPSAIPLVDTGTEVFEEPWRALFHAPGIFKLDLSQPCFTDDKKLYTNKPISMPDDVTLQVRPPTLTGTELIHCDDGLSGPEVAPSIAVSTTFKSQQSTQGARDINSIDWRNPPHHIYSRWTQQVNTRAEHVLSRINEGFAMTYSSGLAAVYAALVFYQPKRISIKKGYLGSLCTIDVFRKDRGSQIEMIDLDDEYQEGDLCFLETPINPTGDSRSIQHYADKIHKVGGKLVVDSTFAPPPLQYPFRFGADCVLHSGKYFGGHSDVLAGVLVVRTAEEWNQLHVERTYLGSTLGSLEAWLLLRSLRTLHLRIPRQSATATNLAQWLNSIAKTERGQSFDGVPGGILARVSHSSLQGTDYRGFNPQDQMQGGWNATFSFHVINPEYARQLPHSLEYFVAATSLGGVESLIEYKHETDSSADPCLVRLSIGLEGVEDLKADLRQAFQKLGDVKAKL